MQLTEIFCYALLAITATASYATAENEQSQSLSKPTEEKNIVKREAALLIGTFAGEPYIPRFNDRVIYRRASRYPQRKLKLSYRSPRLGQSKRNKPRYLSKRPPPHKYSTQTQKKSKKRPPLHYPPKFNKHKSLYSNKHKPVSAPYHALEPTGFGEPPVDYHEGRLPANHKPTYEPPVDSYGAPLNNIPSGNDAFETNQGYSFDTAMQNFDQDNFEYNKVGFNRWNHKHRQNYDHTRAYSKKHPSYVAADPKPEVHHPSLDFEDTHHQSYDDPYSYLERYPRPKERHPAGEKRPTKHLNQNWRGSKLKVADDQHLVGGQYAEPPARYVPKFQPSAVMFTEDEESFGPSGPTRGFDDDTSASGAISSYVNYKNSNMAFSPQNLNDAFSIVD